VKEVFTTSVPAIGRWQMKARMNMIVHLTLERQGAYVSVMWCPA